MARKLRMIYPGALYHVHTRGNNKQDIFIQDEDFDLFLNIFKSIVKRYRWKCYAYCLMKNHYHLLIEIPEINLSEGMRDLNSKFAQRVNLLRGSSGHVFQGRFASHLIDKDSYLLEVARYIVLNPIRSGLVDSPEEWQWSSYKATAGLSFASTLVDVRYILSLFSQVPIEAMQEYKKFVFNGVRP